MVVAGLLWYSSPLPLAALTINFPTLPDGNLGRIYSFTTTVTVENMDLLPIDHIDMQMSNVADPINYVVTCSSLPLSNGESKNYADTGGGAVAVTATISSASDWGRGYGYRTGYGYRDPEGQGEHQFGYGYGYGYATGQGTVTITYSVTWTPPSTWPAGAYNVKLLVYGDSSKKFSGTSSFSLTLPPAGGGGGGGAPAAPGCNSLTPYINTEGVFNLTATFQSQDGKAQLTINRGTTGKDNNGSPLRQICILNMTEPPVPPADTKIIGLVYNISPDGATFTPPITLTFTYDPAQVPAGVDQKKLAIATWDSAASKWIISDNCTVDTTARTISVPISHFTPFTIIARTRPADLVVSGLTISPTQVDAGQAVSISVQVANKGDLAGSYKLTLKINNTAVDTRDISVAGGTTQTVYFTSTQSTGGTYNVDVNGLTGTFTVKPVVVPTPAAFTTSGLSISPAEAEVGETVTISLLVTNSGDLSGTYKVTVKVDNIPLPSKDVTVADHTSQQVTFTTAKAMGGTYTVTVDGLSGTFTIKAGPPIGPTTAMNWWVIGGIIAAVVVIAVVVSLTVRRRAM